MLKNIKNKFVNPDGTLNGKIIAGVISLLIVLVYDIAEMCGFQLKGSADAVANTINVVLLILGMIGVVENPGTVEVPKKLKLDADKVSFAGGSYIKPSEVSSATASQSQSQESDSIANSQSESLK